jgi:hypothetical protein
MLTPAQIDARRGKLTASRVACLMTADTAKIMALYLELTDDPAFVPEDLSEVWPVRLGECTEQLQLDWFDLKRGPVSRRGEVVAHSNGWAACTLDGWSDLHGCPIETKHCGGHEPFEVLVSRYQPQLHWQMAMTGVKQCALSIILGAREPIVDLVEWDEDYGTELWQRATAFMNCVSSRTPPFKIDEPVVPPVPGKTYDMSSSNAWGAEASLWLENIAAKRQAEQAEKTLKAMVPADAKKAFGHSVTITRDRAGRLSLREQTL